MKMFGTAVCGLLLFLVTGSQQFACDQCDCNISGGEVKGVHVTKLTCQDGVVTWYNPTGALRLELQPKQVKRFKTCFVVDSGDVTLKVSKETSRVDIRSPSARSDYLLNDNNLETVLTSQGRSSEVCLPPDESLILYLEPEISELLGYQKISFFYDLVPISTDSTEEQSSIEDCRPCSPTEIVRAYCTSDFVVVGKMDDVLHVDETTHINVLVNQIVRQVGSHFERLHRQSPDLQGTITVPRKCGVVKGDGVFLMTGRVRLGQLRMACAPYLHEWESIVKKAETEGWMECARD